MKIVHDPDPAPLRAKAYPPVGEQLDAVMKLADHLIKNGVDLPTEVRDWVAKCKAVKAKFRKKK